MTDRCVRGYYAPDKVLLQFPAPLPALVQWATTRSGISASAAGLTLHKIAELTPKYQSIVAESARNAAGLECLAWGWSPTPRRIKALHGPGAGVRSTPDG